MNLHTHKMFFLLLAFVFIYISAIGEENLPLEHASYSIYAANTATGEVLVDENASKSLIPSSCLKIVTTAAALELLGPDYRFETQLEYDGTLDKEKTLHGNLYIHGGGDPCLGSDRIASSLSWEAQIEAWVDAIVKLGIKKIEGEVLGDASRWERALAVPSWAWEDLGNYYGAGACALSFHENYYSLFFKPGKREGEEASILQVDPPLPTLVFQNEVKTGPLGSGDRACIYGSEFSPIQYIRGTVPLGVDAFSIKGAIPDPALFCAEALAQSLQKRGIVIQRQKLSPQNKRTSFYTTYSPPIGDIVYWTNIKSINLYAEHLLKKVGEKIRHEGSTVAGAQAIADFWASQQMDLSGFNMIDGSGLSRKNLITAKQLVSILQRMQKSDHFSVFLQSLPDEKNEIHVKTGSMSLVSCCAGYKGDVAFAILINQCTDSKKMREKIQDFLSSLTTTEMKKPQ